MKTPEEFVNSQEDGEISDEVAEKVAGGSRIQMPYHIFAGKTGTSSSNFGW